MVLRALPNMRWGLGVLLELQAPAFLLQLSDEFPCSLVSDAQTLVENCLSMDLWTRFAHRKLPCMGLEPCMDSNLQQLHLH